MCCNHPHYSCGCCGHTCCPSPYQWRPTPYPWYVPQVVYSPAPVVFPASPIEKKIDRILDLAERGEKRAKLNKKKSDRW